MLFRDTPKTSSGYGLRDFFWVFLLTTSVVLVLGIVAMLTGVFSVG